MKAVEAMDVENALKLFETHQDEYGNDPEFISAQAILCIQTQEFEIAHDILSAGIEKHPHNADLLYNKGSLYLILDSGTKALEYFNRAMRNTDDADLIAELKQLCTDIESSQKASYQAKAHAHKEYRPGVNLFMRVENHSGGNVGRLLQQALEVAGISTNVFDLCNPQGMGTEIRKSELYKVNLIIGNVAYVHIEISNIRSSGINLEDFYNIGYMIWELSVLPDRFLPTLGTFQEIWTLSGFCTDAIIDKVSVPVLTVPLYVGSNRTVLEKGRDLFGVKKDLFLFTLAFDCHSSMERKNPQAVVGAFLEAFSPNDLNIGLLIKFIPYELYGKHLEVLFNALSSYPNVYFIDRYLTDKELRTLLYISDTFITLHRAEGFGLLPLEAMALGTPVISTAWSGNMEYMNHTNTALVGYDLIPVDGHYVGSTHGDSLVWANPDINEASKYMRRLIYDNEWKENLIANGRYTADECYNVTMVSKIVGDRLRALQLI